MTREPHLNIRTSTHGAWAELIDKSSLAASLAHTLVSKMDHQNTVVISQRDLSLTLGKSERAIRTALQVLIEEGWISVRPRKGIGGETAYTLNRNMMYLDAEDEPREAVDVPATAHEPTKRKPGRKPSLRTAQIHPKLLPAIAAEISSEAQRRGVTQGALVEEAWALYKATQQE